MSINPITQRLLAAGVTTTLAAGAMIVLPAALGYESAEAKSKWVLPAVLGAVGGATYASARNSGGYNSPGTVGHDGNVRSTFVSLKNETGCDLEYVTDEVTQGMWADNFEPNRDRNFNAATNVIGNGKQWTFKAASASTGLGTLMGTSGWVEWKTKNCARKELNDKKARFGWKNVPVIPNSYDFSGTDSMLEGSKGGSWFNGWGTNARVSITFKAR